MATAPENWPGFSGNLPAASMRKLSLLAVCRAALQAIDDVDTRDIPEDIMDGIRALKKRLPGP